MDNAFSMFSVLVAAVLFAAANLVVARVAIRRARAAMEREKAREAHKLNEIFFDTSPFVMNIWGEGPVLLATSRQAMEMFELSCQEQYLERFFDLSPELQPCGTASREKALDFVQRAFAEDGVKFEWMHQNLKGEPIPTEISLVRFTHQGENRVAAYTVDLRPVVAKREADEMTRKVLEALPMFIEIWNDGLEVIDCNRRTLDTFGLGSKDEYIARYHEFSPHIQPGGRPSYKNAVGFMEKALSEGESRFEWTHLRPDGRPLPVEVICVRVHREGKPLIVAFNHDISPIKDALNRELAAENRADILLNSAPMSCYLLDAKYQAVGCNQAAIDLFAKEPGKSLAATYPDTEVFAKCEAQGCLGCWRHLSDACAARNYLIANYRLTFPNYEREKERTERVIAERCERALEKGSHKCEVLSLTLFGEAIPCEVTIVPVKFHDGYGFAVYRRDLREEKRREAAEEESRAKTQFLARMSHEIRTPMNAIVGMTELAMRCDTLDDAREHILTVKQAGANLLSIINDILDISKVEQGKFEIVQSDYGFSSLLNDVVSIIRMKVADSDINFVVNVDSGIPNSLLGDEVRIRQVLLNLLSNAVKYTDAGGFVSLNIRGEPNGKDSIILTMDVEDSGRGIKEDDLEKLFGEYVQFDLAKNKGVEGTGLGLAITWHMVKAMDGNIDVRSVYGKGSTFTVTLPQTVRHNQSLGQVDNAAEKKTLIYERREIYAKSLISAASGLGVECTRVADDADLLEKLSQGKHAFAFVSFELYKDNKDAISDLRHGTGLVILTEFGETVSDKKLVTLAMPVHSVSMANALNGGREGGSFHGGSGFTARFTAPDASVLVVDDVLTNLKVVKGLLSPYGVQVSLCKSGEMALDAIQIGHYDMVLMDYLMPDMDGVQTTERIRKLGVEDEYLAKVPIVALTANAMSGMKGFFLGNGFNDFMSKPVDVAKLDGLLERWIPKEKQLRQTAV